MGSPRARAVVVVFAFLKTRPGWLVADAHRGYDGLYTRPGALVIEVACWAHARRAFAELAQANDARAAPMIKLIGRLYEIEHAATADSVEPDERLRRRCEHSDPVTMQIGALCAEIINTNAPSDDLTRAAGYIVNQWAALRHFLEDGRLPIDNTLVERALRPVAVGRKNYLFCGSDAGAERAASAYTLAQNLRARRRRSARVPSRHPLEARTRALADVAHR